MLRKIADFLQFRRPAQPHLIELKYTDVIAGGAEIFASLCCGSVVIVRGIAPIIAGRAEMIKQAASFGKPGTAEELENFYINGIIPSIGTISALGEAIKFFRSNRIWSRLLHGFFSSMQLPGPVLYDGGIPRLVIPQTIVETARASGMFDPADFKRKHAAGATEIFMPAPANLHRDFNRQHFLFQLNIWWPMHDASEREVLRVYPHLYRQLFFDRDCSPEALKIFGPHLAYKLAFGDAVIFHGEQLHTSPIGIPDGRRQSVDFRVAAHCHDDNTHYRQGFLSAANFTPGSMQTAVDNPGGMQAAVDNIVQMEQHAQTLSKEWFDIEMTKFCALPFAEDRYLLLHDAAKDANPKAAVAALEKIIGLSPEYFWLLKAGQLAQQMGHTHLATKSAARILALSPALPNYMPVDYHNPPNQIMPEAARAWAEGLVH